MSENLPGLSELVAAINRLSIAITSQPTAQAPAAQASQGATDWELISEDSRSAEGASELDRRRALVTDGDYNSFP